MKDRKNCRLLRFFLMISLIIVFSGCATYGPGAGPAGYEPGTEPWIVLGGERDLDVTICWLSRERTETRLLFAKEGEDPKLLETEDSPGKLHNVRLEDLVPGERYFYAPLFDETSEVADSFYSFEAPPAEKEAFRVVIVGDMQPTDEFTTRGGRLVATGIDREDPDLVVQLGDLAYIGGLFRDWRRVLDNMSVFSPEVPFQAVPGNHDQYALGGLNFAKFFPYDFIDDSGLYYSFDYGGIHFVMMNAFEFRGKDLSVKQKKWVEEDIASAREDGAGWIFLFIHNTVLSSGTMGTVEPLAAWLLPLADEMDVDAVFYGHDHHYEHWLVKYGEMNLVFDPSHEPRKNPVHYWCAGGGGGKLETDYGILTKEYKPYSRRMFSTVSGEELNMEVLRFAWDPEQYIDYTGNPEYGRLEDGKHYYQLPDDAFRSDTRFFGYSYGEQTLHYIRMDVAGDAIRISVRYPNGDLLTGPGGEYPQEFTLLER